MALYDIALESTPIDVTVSSNGDVLTVLRNTGIDLIKWYPGKPRNAKNPEVTSNVTTFKAEDNVRQIAFLSPSRVAVLTDSDDCCILKHFEIESTTCTESGEDILPQNTTRIVPDAFGAQDELYYVDNHRVLSSVFNSTTNKREFPTPCPWVELAMIDEQVCAKLC